MTDCFDSGTSRRLGVSFFDVNGSPGVPLDIRFTMREPDGVLTEYAYGTGAQVKPGDGPGQYYVDWEIRKPGRHVARWEGVADLSVAVETEFYARRDNTVV